MLDHIKETKCSECGAEIRSSKQYDKHCFGHWNEEVEFKCGKTLHHSPNGIIGMISVTAKCQNSKEVIEEKKLEKELLQFIINKIKESKVSEKFKKSFLQSLSVNFYYLVSRKDTEL